MLKVLEQLLHKIKANRRREMVLDTRTRGKQILVVWSSLMIGEQRYDADTKSKRLKNFPTYLDTHSYIPVHSIQIYLLIRIVPEQYLALYYVIIMIVKYNTIFFESCYCGTNVNQSDVNLI